MRKTSIQEANAMQVKQVQAAIRKLSRRILIAHEGVFRDWLIACRAQVAMQEEEA